MKMSNLALRAALVASFTSISAFADLKPIAGNTKANEIAIQANDIFSVKEVRSGNLTYKLVTMSSVLNGDTNNTSILLTGQEVGGEAGYDSAFLISPTATVQSADDLQLTDKGVTLSVQTQKGNISKRTVRYDEAKKILVQGAPSVTKNCNNQGNTNDTYACVVAANTAADATLGAVYKKLLGSLDKTGGTKLVSAQKAWLAFRESECGRISDEMRGSTYEKVSAMKCSADMTVARSTALLTSSTRN